MTEGFKSDSFLGTVFRQEYNAIDELGTTSPYPPALTEEYFEWIALLSAVLEAGESFTFLELGAGYGRWSIRAAAAARQQGRRVRLGCVEAEPKHFEWLTQTLTDNGIDPSEQLLHRAAICGTGGHTSFEVGNQSARWAPAAFYGQALIRPMGVGIRAGTEHLIRRLRNRALYGLEVVTVEAMTLDELLEPLQTVDLVDLDIQGAELEVIVASSEVSRKVKRLYIETHSKDVENGLRRHLGRLGWKADADYGLKASHKTPYGRVTCRGGVQSWINPRRS